MTGGTQGDEQEPEGSSGRAASKPPVSQGGGGAAGRKQRGRQPRSGSQGPVNQAPTPVSKPRAPPSSPGSTTKKKREVAVSGEDGRDMPPD